MHHSLLNDAKKAALDGDTIYAAVLYKFVHDNVIQMSKWEVVTPEVRKELEGFAAHLKQVVENL